MATSTDIGRIGEQIVAQELKEKGYQTNVDTKQAGATDIEAEAPTNKLLVQVRTAVLPSLPASLSALEGTELKARASQLGLQAWEAKVQLDFTLKQIGKIQWRQIA